METWQYKKNKLKQNKLAALNKQSYYIRFPIYSLDVKLSTTS